MRSFKRKSITDFIKRNYHPSVTVFSVSGSIGLEKAVALAEEFFGGKKSSTSIPKRGAFKKYQSSEVEIPKSISQVHYISGIPAYALNDPRRYTLVLLNNLLGGPGMNSRLNLNVREKYGFTYTIESGYHTYSDTGIFFLYFATDQKHFTKTLKLANQELKKLCDQPLGDKLFQQYREQLLGQIMMAQENRLSVFLSRSKAFLNFGSVISVDEIRAKVKSVSAKDIQTAAKDLLGNKDRSALIYKPS
ncbi:MAG: M16 family metallopeptidase [Bacteroidota bacterium]